MKLILHIDGASRGNPGPAAVGVMVTDVAGTVLVEVSEYIGETTNNVAEYRALLRGLQEAARFGAKDVLIYGDSQLVIRQMNGQYRVRHQVLLPLYNQAQNMIQSFAHVSFTHVPREQNVRADELANQALDEQAKKGSTSKQILTTKLQTAYQGPKRQRLLSVPELALNRIEINLGQEFSEKKSPVAIFVYVLSGEGAIAFADEKMAAQAGDTFFVPRYTHFSAKNTGQEPLIILLGLIPNTEGENYDSNDHF